jgi:pimeloyl-ACP methyl ester carboxylesterase
MPYFLRDGVRFHYQDIGAGRSLVLSHAIGRDLTQIQRYVGAPPHFRVVCWDARAHGLTEPIGPLEQLNFATFADDLAALLDHLGIETAILGGISMGAATSIAFCSRHPARVRAAILIRSAWLAEPHPKSLQSIELVGRLLGKHSVDQARQLFLQSEEYRALREASVDTANQIMREFDHPSAVERAARFVQITASGPIENWQQLKSCNMPILVVGCANDPFHPVKVSQTWAEHLPNAQFATVPSPIDNLDQHIRKLRETISGFLGRM